MNTLRAKGVAQKLGISISMVWRLEKVDPTFPQSFRLSEAVKVWDSSDVDNWLTHKKEGVTHESQ